MIRCTRKERTSQCCNEHGNNSRKNLSLSGGTAFRNGGGMDRVLEPVS